VCVCVFRISWKTCSKKQILKAIREREGMIENDQMNMYLHGWLTQFFLMSIFFILQKKSVESEVVLDPIDFICIRKNS